MDCFAKYVSLDALEEAAGKNPPDAVKCRRCKSRNLRLKKFKSK